MYLKQFFFREGVACSFLSNRLFGVVVRAFPDGVVVCAFPDGVVVCALTEELVVRDFSKELVVCDFYEGFLVVLFEVQVLDRLSEVSPPVLARYCSGEL